MIFAPFSLPSFFLSGRRNVEAWFRRAGYVLEIQKHIVSSPLLLPGFTVAESRLFVFDSSFLAPHSLTLEKLSVFPSPSELEVVLIGAALRRRRRNGSFVRSSSDERDERDHERGERRKVCEHLTFPLLLWGLVLVKRSSRTSSSSTPSLLAPA